MTRRTTTNPATIAATGIASSRAADQMSGGGFSASRRVPSVCAQALFAGWSFFSILAQVSRSVTVRLKTRAPGRESFESTQKYPCRSNCQRLPGAAEARPGSTRHPVRTTSDSGLRCDFQSVFSTGLPADGAVSSTSSRSTSARSPSPGISVVKRWL